MKHHVHCHSMFLPIFTNVIIITSGFPKHVSVNIIALIIKGCIVMVLTKCGAGIHGGSGDSNNLAGNGLVWLWPW